MDVFDKFLRNVSYKFDKGYPNSPEDMEILMEMVNNLVEAEDEEKSTLSKEDIIKIIQSSEYTDKQLARLDQLVTSVSYSDEIDNVTKAKNLTSKEEAFLSKQLDNYNQYKIYTKYIENPISYADFPDEGNAIDILKTKGFSEDFLKVMLSVDFQAGGRGVGPGEFYFIVLTKDAKKATKGDLMTDEGEVEVKAGSAMLSPFGRTDTWNQSIEFLKSWLNENAPEKAEDALQAFNSLSGKRGFNGLFRKIPSVLNVLDTEEVDDFINDFSNHIEDRYSQHISIDVNKYFRGDNLDAVGLENEIAKKLAQAYVDKEGVEQFLFLNKKTGRYVKYPTSELINTIGKDIVVTSMQDMTTRLSLKKPVN
jgi:hypothetical protein